MERPSVRAILAPFGPPLPSNLGTKDSYDSRRSRLQTARQSPKVDNNLSASARRRAEASKWESLLGCGRRSRFEMLHHFLVLVERFLQFRVDFVAAFHGRRAVNGILVAHFMHLLVGDCSGG